MKGKLTLECGNDEIFTLVANEFLKHYRRAVTGKKKSKFNQSLIDAMKDGKIHMFTEPDTEAGKHGGVVQFEMEGTKKELDEWMKFSLFDKLTLALFTKSGVLKLKTETWE